MEGAYYNHDIRFQRCCQTCGRSCDPDSAKASKNFERCNRNKDEVAPAACGTGWRKQHTGEPVKCHDTELCEQLRRTERKIEKTTFYQKSSNSIASSIQANEGIILHNISNSHERNKKKSLNINRSEYECVYCKMLLRQISSFLKNVKGPNEKEKSGICTHCKNINTTSKCKRCSYLVSKIEKEKENFESVQKWKDMLSQIKLFLETVIKGTRKSSSSSVEELLKEFTSTKIIRIKDVGVQKLLDVKIPNYKNERVELDTQTAKEANGSEVCLSNENMGIDPGKDDACICKLLANKVFERSPPSITEEKSFTLNTLPQERVGDIKSTESKLNEKKWPHRKDLKISKKSVKVGRGGKIKEKKSGKVQSDKSSELFMKMILKNQKNRKRDRTYNLKESNLKELGKYANLELEKLQPMPKKEVKQILSEESLSVVECADFSQTSEVIKGNKIVTVEQYNKLVRHPSRCTVRPLTFKVKENFSYPTVDFSQGIRQKELGHEITTELPRNDGFIKYQLSNRKYLEEGFTVMPTFKSMRRINVYKMISSHSKFDWFVKYKDHKYMYYSTGEKLVETNQEDQVRWYYRDGCLALHFRPSKKIPTHEFVIYDSAELKKKSGQSKGTLILACINKMGHGIVYDRNGHVRLKYNQFEGMLMDKSVGPLGRWKWHSLNDPPVLLQLSEEECLDYTYDCLEELIQSPGKSEINSNSYIFDKEMYTIELDNMFKETSKRMPVKYKPFEIQFKVLKLNEHFTLKILDQSKIYLLFRDGEISFKLNLGMKLISNEIIGIETVSIDGVVTPYDHVTWTEDSNI